MKGKYMASREPLRNPPLRWPEYGPFRSWLLDELATRGWKPIDLAQRINPKSPVSAASSLSKWMRGELRPTPKSCKAIADALGADLDHVLTLAGHRPAERESERAELISDISAMLERLPDEQVAFINTSLRAIYDQYMKERAESEKSRSEAGGSSGSSGGDGSVVTNPHRTTAASKRGIGATSIVVPTFV
jgi:transcriptional regulator with XRE-family HTH domain